MQASSDEAQVVRVGQLVAGKYRVVERIGAGGMGCVYRARHEGLGKDVALKFLLPHLARNGTLAQRFMREGSIAATLESPHVIRVLDVDRLPEGTPYLVLEFLHGRSLQGWLNALEEGETLPLATVLNVAEQAIAGLQLAHSKGIVHRDLKPDNIFACATPDGATIKLLDFGIAKIKSTSEYQALTKPGMAMGTPEYMAPEQAISADQADERSDVYAFGSILFEMLSGQLPVTGDTPQKLVAKRMAGEVASLATHRPELPAALISLVDSCLQLVPQARPQSAAAVAQELRAVARSLAEEPANADSGDPQGSTRPNTDQQANADAKASTNRPTQAEPHSPRERSAEGSPMPRYEPTAEMKQPPVGLARSEGVAKTISSPPPTSGAAGPAKTVSLPAEGRSGRLKWLWLAGALLLLGAAAAALLLMQQVDPGPPPPMPTPQPGSGLGEYATTR